MTIVEHRLAAALHARGSTLGRDKNGRARFKQEFERNLREVLLPESERVSGRPTSSHVGGICSLGMAIRRSLDRAAECL